MRDEPTLAYQTGNPVVDRILSALVGMTELLIPGRVVGYYLSGSHANGNPVPTSDLDLLVVLGPNSTPKHAEGLKATYRQCGRLTPMMLDAVVATEDELRRLGPDWIASDRKFLHGRDVLADLPPSVPGHVEVRRWMHGAVSILRGHYQRDGVVRVPVEPPDPADEWLGFACRPVRLPDGREEPGVRWLVVTTYWPANALIVRRTGACVIWKDRGMADRFAELFGDRWFGFLLDVFTRCKNEWHYRIPADPAARADLRRLCEGAVEFHNHFFAEHRDYLLGELRDPDPTRRRPAAQSLSVVRHRDPELEDAVRAAGRDDPAVLDLVGWPDLAQPSDRIA